MLVNYNTDITIDSDEILDEMGVGDIEDYLESKGIGYYYLCAENDIINQSATLASVIQDSINGDERIAFNVVLALDDTTRELLKKELNDFNKGTTRGI